MCMCVWEGVCIHIYLYLYAAVSKGMEAQAIFLNRLTVCSSSKWKFVVCLFVSEETNGSYPFANGINRLNGLDHLWFF